MPKQNRPMVRDGRLQAPKKRTDRSYLTTAPGPAETAVEEVTDADIVAPAADLAPVAVEAAAVTAPDVASSAQARATGVERALQQQGVRKRREFDVQALARRDTKYAYHELRRIAILATMVVITLIVLTFVLR